ncbi:DNA repair protein RAD52 homolog [Venturia canescens]|uniref:DNA repair protein RAD52 homolog n=1 Tax=Venturia canescens TaxID=32260 RepID=UPI001C9C2D20|nr:DNA repair protein RAD52 homolog [Venturia canescens]
MSFPSCIKIPGAKSNSVSQNSSNNGITKDHIPYEELVAIANSVFGESRWSHAVTSQTVDFVEYVMGKYHIGCAAFVRVQLADGTFHEDMGYSNTESSIKGSAIQSARSLSITVALKKALTCFGDIIEEKITEKTYGMKRFKREPQNKLPDEKVQEQPMKMQLTLTENSLKDSNTVENVIHCVEENVTGKKPATKLKTPSTPTRNKSPIPTDTNGEAPVINDPVVMIAESDNVVNDPSNLVNNNGATLAPSGVLTEDELRMERKRRQKQKQEEYKRLMKEKLSKAEEKPNPKF